MRLYRNGRPTSIVFHDEAEGAGHVSLKIPDAIRSITSRKLDVASLVPSRAT